MDTELDSEFSLSKNAYQEFLSFCSQALDKEDLKILNLLKLKYEACSEEFKNSEQMVILLKNTQKNIEQERSRMFVHLKDMVTELKSHGALKKLKKEQKRQFSDDSDSETQIRKVPILSPCKVLVTKLDSVSEVASPEKSKVCHISTGILCTVQEIKVADEEQQVSLFKELGCFQNNVSVKSPCRNNPPLVSHQGDKRELLVILDKSSADDLCYTKSSKSERQSSMLSPLKIKPQPRKSTIICNTSFTNSPDIQTIIVSPCHIARPSTSKGIFDGLATDMTTTVSVNKDVTSLGYENSEEIPCLKNKLSSRDGHQQKIFHTTVSSDESQYRENINSVPVSDRILTNKSNCAKMLFLQKPLAVVDKKGVVVIDSSLSDTEKNSTVQKDDHLPLDNLSSSFASTSEHDCLQKKECNQNLSVKLNDPQIQEKLLIKEAEVVLTNCQLQSASNENSVFKSKEPKRALFTTLNEGNIVANKRFSSSGDNESRDSKLKTVFSEVEGGCASSDEFQGSIKTDDKQLLKNERHVRKLEALLESLRNEIEKCQNQELSLDALDDETSAYIYEDKLKKKFVAVWNKLCEITKRSVSTGRPTERTIKYSGTRYEEINHRLERFLNKRKIFPDFTDIKNIVKLTNKKYKMNLSSTSIDSIAREAFVDIGEMLQTRRHQDFIATFGNRQTDCIRNGNDPYMTDPELRRKLDSNRRIAKSKLDDVIAKFSKLQDERKNGDDDEEEETEDENVAPFSEKRKSKNRLDEDDKDEEIESSTEDDVINRKSTLSAVNSSPSETYNPLDNQLSENVSLKKSDSDTKSHLTSFVKALGLSPLGLTKNKEVSPSPLHDCSAATNENIIVIGESPSKALNNVSKRTDFQKDNCKFMWSGSGQSRESAILLNGPNLKFTARKLSTHLPSDDPVLSVPLDSQLTRSISYDEIALENEEDQEDQSSESDRGGSDEEEDDDIMIINSSASESDTESSRGASPVSVILLSSSDDETENTVGSDLRFSGIKQEIPSETEKDHLNPSWQQHCKPDLKNSLSDILDLASSALSTSCKNRFEKGIHSVMKVSTLSTEFLDLATGKTRDKNQPVSGSHTCSEILSHKPLGTDSKPGSGLLTATIVNENRTFSPISFLREDSNAAVDKFEVTIEVDDECYESSLPIAAENDSYINHQNIAKSKTKSHHMSESVDLVNADDSSVVSVIDLDELPEGDKNGLKKSNAGPAAESSVIFIDEVSQDVLNTALTEKVMAVDNTASSSTHTEKQEDKTNSSCIAASVLQCSSNANSEELMEATNLKDSGDVGCFTSAADDSPGNDSQQSMDVTVAEASPLIHSMDVTVAGASPLIHSLDEPQSDGDTPGVIDNQLDLPATSSVMVSDEANSSQLNVQLSRDINKTEAEVNPTTQGECSSKSTGVEHVLTDIVTDQLVPSQCNNRAMAEHDTDLEEVALLSMDTSDESVSKSQEDSIQTDVVPCEAEDIKNKAEDTSFKDPESVKEVNSVETEVVINEEADISLADNSQNSETINKPSTDSLIADYEEDDDFKSIFRICGEIIQNTEEPEGIQPNTSKESVPCADHSNSGNSISEIAQSDRPPEETLVNSSNNDEAEDTTEMQKNNKDESVRDSASSLQASDISPTTDGGANPQATDVADQGPDDSPEEEKSTLEEQQQVASCEDEVEIIEELSNAKGQRQCMRTKEEDREWIAQQLNKLKNCSSDEVSTSSELISSESSITPADREDKTSSSELKGGEEILDLDMEVECIENGPESSTLNDSAAKADVDVIKASSDVSERKRKRENPENEKNTTAESASSNSAFNSKETMEPPSKKKLVDPNFITQLISTVYNEFPPGILAKKPVPAPTNDEDEDVLVVEEHFKPRSVISKPSQPSLLQSGFKTTQPRFPNHNKNIHYQGRFPQNPASMPRNKLSNFSPAPSSSFDSTGSRAQSRTFPSAVSTVSFQRAAYNNSLSSGLRQRSHGSLVKPSLPNLSPRVPIPNIQRAFDYDSTRHFSKPFLPLSHRRSGPNPNTLPANRSALNDKKSFTPYMKNFPSTSASSHSSVRQNSVFHRNQRPPMTMAPRFNINNQRARYPQPISGRSPKFPARKLDGAEIILDDSDTEDSAHQNHSSSTPVILSVTSLSSESSSDKTTTLKKSNSKNSGDTIVLSDSD
ncbi:hypothetical protein Btru_058535 [Bulinus truncatus]|nr:hypothetical protein Btru_058535 [Bulinus truncatus]